MQSAYDDTKLLARICGCGFAVCGFLHYVLSSHCQQGLICQSSSSLLHFTVYMENKRLKKRSYACKTPSIVSKSSEPFSSSSHFFLQILRNAFVKTFLHYLCQKTSYNKKNRFVVTGSTKLPQCKYKHWKCKQLVFRFSHFHTIIKH